MIEFEKQGYGTDDLDDEIYLLDSRGESMKQEVADDVADD